MLRKIIFVGLAVMGAAAVGIVPTIYHYNSLYDEVVHGSEGVGSDWHLPVQQKLEDMRLNNEYTQKVLENVCWESLYSFKLISHYIEEFSTLSHQQEALKDLRNQYYLTAAMISENCQLLEKSLPNLSKDRWFYDEARRISAGLRKKDLIPYLEQSSLPHTRT